jgi:beta-glucanase (GH16 family)
VLRPRMLIAMAVAGAGLATALYLPSKHDTASAATGGITWQDEFNAPAGTAVDSSKWNFDIGGGGFGNNEREYYTNSTRNAVQDGQGNLVITARKENPNNYQCWYGACQYTSARMLTSGKFTQKYGHFEARLKTPKGQGIWPAFWLLGDNLGSVGWPNSGEIDIMENIGKEPNTVYGTIHGPGYSGSGGISKGTTNGAPLGDGFHTYAIDWSPNLIVWTFDNVEYHRVTPASLNGNNWVFDHPFFIIMNVAVGGFWPGDPDATSTYPQSMTVDYVRVSAYTTTPPTTKPPTTPPATTKPPTTPPATTKPPTTPPVTTKPPTTPPVTSKPPTSAPPQAGAWAPYTAYTVGQIVTYNGVRYQVRQSHTSIPGWEPPNVLALFLPL